VIFALTVLAVTVGRMPRIPAEEFNQDADGGKVTPLNVGGIKLWIPRAYLMSYNNTKESQSGIRLKVFYPDFLPRWPFQQMDKRNKEIVADFIDFGILARPIKPVDEILERQFNMKNPYTLKSYKYDLTEKIDSVFPDKKTALRLLIAKDGDAKFIIICSDPDLHDDSWGLLDTCQSDFDYHGVTGFSQYSFKQLSNWRSIYRRQIAILDSFREK
jgi:hypothetical protein